MSTARIRPADIAEVQAFVAAVRTGSLSRAAVELRVSTPAIAKRMRQLETLAGRPLLERSNRGVRLTPAGRAVFDDATRLVEAADSLFTVLDGTREPTRVAGLQSLLQRPSETTPSTESILAEAEQLLARLFQTTREGLVVSRPSDGMIFEANDAFCSLLGFRREQLVGRTSLDLLLWADKADRTFIVAHAAAGGREPMQLRLRGADGELRDVEVIASTIRLGGEERLLLAFRGRSDVRGEDAAVGLPSLENVTERTVRDRAQREAEQQCRMGFDDAPVCMALATTSGRFLRVNRAFAAMLGYTSDELIGVPASSVTVPEDRVRDREQRSRLLERELDIDRRRKRFLDATGRVVTVNLSERIVRDDAGSALYMAARTDDISGELAAERRFRTLSEKAPVGIFEIDPDGSCVWANTAMEALTGCTGDALLGSGWIAAVHRDDRDRVAAASLLTADGDDLALAYRFETPAGAVRWIQGSATALLDDAGTISGYLGTAADVTACRIAGSAL